MKARTKLTIALTGALAALVLGSIAWAAIPDNSGVIHGCYKKDTGAVRVYDSSAAAPKVCTAKEAPLDWNQQGPSHAYFNPQTGLAMVTETSWPGSQISGSFVPAGSYLFIVDQVAKAFGANSPQHNVTCRLLAHDKESGSEYWANSRATVSSNALGESVFTPMTMSVARTFGPQGGFITVYCIAPTPSQVESVHLSALQVGAIHY